jgi:hypothetical protein
LPLREWIDLTFVKICTRHTSANAAALMSFKATEMLANVLLDKGRVTFAIHGIEQLAFSGDIEAGRMRGC